MLIVYCALIGYTRDDLALALERGKAGEQLHLKCKYVNTHGFLVRFRELTEYIQHFLFLFSVLAPNA